MQCLVLKGHGQAQNAHVAFEVAAERIDKQLRRYMRRLKDKGSPSQPSATLDEIQANASYIVFDAGAEEEEAGGGPGCTAPTTAPTPGPPHSLTRPARQPLHTTPTLYVTTKHTTTNNNQ